MNEEHWLRPDVRRMLWLLGILLAGLFTFLGAATTYAFYFWPDHKVLESTAVEWVFGSLALIVIIAGPSLVSYCLFHGPVAWKIDSSGIAVYRNDRQVRIISWKDVGSLEVRRYGVIARVRTEPRIERLHWVAPQSTALLKGFAEQQGISAR